MFDTMFDYIGNLNPQLLRELKGRLNWRSVLTVIAVSIVVQLLLFLWFYAQLPTPTNYYFNPYCSHLVGGAVSKGCYTTKLNPQPYVIHWLRWWEHISSTLNCGIPFLLMVPGTYLLLSDLQNEQRQGTLDFIRLSPQSASSILIGKILGTPILVYCAIASLIPFHLFAILKTGNSPSFLLSFYSLLVAGSFLLFSFTLLFGFFSKSILMQAAQALGFTILYVLIVGAIFVPGYLLWNSEMIWTALLPFWSSTAEGLRSDWVWFGLPLSQNVAIAHLFTFLNITILSGFIWHGLTRCYHQPSATILRKRQSYGLVFYLQLLILGIGIRYQKEPLVDNFPTHFGMVILPMFLNLPIFLTLIALLSPQRQAVMDWARYRRSQSARSSLFKDLLFNDQSPAGLAIIVNLAIAASVWLITFAFRNGWAVRKTETALITLISLCLIALYASVIQWIVIQKTRQRNFIATTAIISLILIPPAFVFLLPFQGVAITTLKQVVMLTSPFLWLFQGSEHLISSIWIAFGAQISLIAGMNALIARQVRHLGTSELKASQKPFARLNPDS